MRILCFVEGQGDQNSLPALLSRLHAEACASNRNAWAEPMILLSPWRLGPDKISKRRTLQSYVRQAIAIKDFDALLVLIDSDIESGEACPKREAEERSKWIRETINGKAFAYVFAHREYEAWFLAALDSLRGVASIRPDATPPDNPEGIRGAKESIEKNMLPRRVTRYRETVHQREFTKLFDMKSAYRACRSFRKLTKAFGDFYCSQGKPIPQWPPADWL